MLVSALILGKLPSRERQDTIFPIPISGLTPDKPDLGQSLTRAARGRAGQRHLRRARAPGQRHLRRARAGSEALAARARAGSEALAARARARSSAFAARTATVERQHYSQHCTALNALPVAHPTYRRAIFACPPAVCFIFPFLPRARAAKSARASYPSRVAGGVCLKPCMPHPKALIMNASAVPSIDLTCLPQRTGGLQGITRRGAQGHSPPSGPKGTCPPEIFLGVPPMGS